MIEKLTDLIKNLGFPVVVAVSCGITMTDMYATTVANYETREKRLYQQIEGFQHSLDSFNDTLLGINHRLGVIENEFK